MGWILIEMKAAPNERFAVSDTTPIRALDSDKSMSAYIPYNSERAPMWMAINPVSVKHTNNFEEAHRWLTEKSPRGGYV